MSSTDKTTYTCPACAKTFRHRQSASRHRISVHNIHRRRDVVGVRGDGSDFPDNHLGGNAAIALTVATPQPMMSVLPDPATMTLPLPVTEQLRLIPVSRAALGYDTGSPTPNEPASGSADIVTSDPLEVGNAPPPIGNNDPASEGVRGRAVSLDAAPEVVWYQHPFFDAHRDED